MQVGVFLTNQNPVGSDLVAALEEQLAMTRLARDRGWDVVATGQHYLSEGASQLQLVPFLSRLAAEAGHMTGVAGVLLIGLHNPVEMAEMVASLDVIWGGRFVFGIGLGYRDVEFDAFKVPRGRRVRRFEACLEVIKRLWTGQPVDFESSYCRLEGATMALRPVQRPHPPIWVAANNDRAVERAAEIGDTWIINPHATVATIERQMGLYRAALERHGKPFPIELPMLREICVADTREEAVRLARPSLEEKYRAYVAWGQHKALPGDDDMTAAFDELVQDRFIIGDPAACADEIRRCVDAVGANTMIFRLNWPGMPREAVLRGMQLLAEQVRPRTASR